MKTIANKTTAMKQIESKTGGDIEELLRKLYVDDALSREDIARQLNISPVTLMSWLKLAGIHSRRLHIRA